MMPFIAMIKPPMHLGRPGTLLVRLHEPHLRHDTYPLGCDTPLMCPNIPKMRPHAPLIMHDIPLIRPYKPLKRHDTQLMLCDTPIMELVDAQFNLDESC